MSHMTTKASPRPAKGSARKLQQARRRLADTRERAAKDAAKARDGYLCRRCGYPGAVRVEAAHIRSAGMGGDPTGLRSWKASDYITLCHSCHQGPRSVHSGHVVMVVGPKGGDGPVQFVDQVPGGWPDEYYSERKQQYVRVTK